MICSGRSNEAAAAFAIGAAALPTAYNQMRDARLSERASIARAVAGPGSAAATAASYNSIISSRSLSTGIGVGMELMRSSSRRLWQRCCDHVSELLVRAVVCHIELHHATTDMPIRRDNEHVARIKRSVGRAVEFRDLLVRITGEEIREA